jgi:heat shock protein HslJ
VTAIRRGAALTVLAIGLATCVSPPAPSPSASVPSAVGQPTATTAFDFGGTAWRVQTMDGQPVVEGMVPTLQFQTGTGTTGSGAAFSGCSSFGFDWTLDGGRAQIRPQSVDLGTCTGIAAQVETAFLARLAAATAYTGSGDSLSIVGPAGQIQLTRDVPPVGDPGRAVIDLLRTGEWRVTAAPGIPAANAPTGIRFTDTGVFAIGSCGFGGGFRLLPQGVVRFEEIGWDTIGGCDAADDAARNALKRLLESATTARIGADGKSVVFSGPNGEAVLGR